MILTKKRAYAQNIYKKRSYMFSILILKYGVNLTLMPIFHYRDET